MNRLIKGFLSPASDVLRQVDTHILTDERCVRKFWGKPDPKIQLCAGETYDEKDTCQVSFNYFAT